MPLLVLALLGLAFLLPLVLLPLSIVQRYRIGTAERPARAWVATLNVTGFTLSAGVIMVTSTVMALWVPRALPVTLAALAAGVVLGAIGLSLSAWENRAGIMYFRPNRWLVGVLTALVLLRLGYGVWRSWHAWMAWGGEAGWLSSAGVAGSIAAGALLVGYGLGFWVGVRWRISRRQSAGLRYI
jgi:membrane protein CcdC involved in cytochrome C biogenesis